MNRSVTAVGSEASKRPADESRRFLAEGPFPLELTPKRSPATTKRSRRTPRRSSISATWELENRVPHVACHCRMILGGFPREWKEGWTVSTTVRVSGKLAGPSHDLHEAGVYSLQNGKRSAKRQRHSPPSQSPPAREGIPLTSLAGTGPPGTGFLSPSCGELLRIGRDVHAERAENLRATERRR